MNYITKQTIEPGELTYCNYPGEGDNGVVISKVFVVAKHRKKGHCCKQCSLYNKDKVYYRETLENGKVKTNGVKSVGGCNGFCYKWKNCDTIVFEMAEADDNATIVENPYMASVRLQKEESKRIIVERYESVI